jgi:predicted negative regulator of RcsB-dependent stress response
MSTSLYLLTICLPLATILLVFGMRYYAAIQQARVRSASESSYQQIAERAAAAQAGMASALASIDASLADVRSRLAAVEKILKDVG